MDRIKQLVLPEGVDGALITSDINRRYFTGMKSSAGMLLIFKECAYLIIDFRYIEKARNTVKNCTVMEQENLTEQIDKALRRIIKEDHPDIHYISKIGRASCRERV